MVPSVLSQAPWLTLTAACHTCCIGWNNSSQTAIIGSWVYGVQNNVNGGGGFNEGVGNQWQCPTPVAPDPGKSNGLPPCPNCVGDPINAGTGNVFRREEEFAAGRWLVFNRYYNSAPSAGAGQLGLRWRHTYLRSVNFIAGTAPNPDTVTVTREDGRVVTYRFTAGLWSGEPDVFDELVEQKDGAGNRIGWLFKRVDTRSTEQFDITGRLTAIQDPEGFVVTLAYSNASTPTSIAPGPGYLISVTDPFQRAIGLTYDASGHLATVASPDGQVINYAYDASGNLATASYPDGKQRTYLYNEPSRVGGAQVPGLLTGIIDENQARYVSYSYDANGKAIANELAGGVDAFAITYNSDGSATVTDPLGATRNHTFTVIQGVPKAVGLNGACKTCGTVSAREYDITGLVSKTTDFNGNITSYQHNSEGLLTGSVDNYGSQNPRSIQTDWNNVFHLPTERRIYDYNYNLIEKFTWSYNGRGQVTAACEIDASKSAALSYVCGSAATAPDGVRQRQYSYCDTIGTGCPFVGLRLSETGPRTDLSQVSSIRYYTTSSASAKAGDVYQTVDALGYVTTYTSYDGAGRVTGMIDANGVTTSFTYTSRGWLKIRAIGSAVTTFDYDGAGNVIGVTDPDNIKISYTYDAAHRLTDITDALGNRIHYTLDAAGNKTKEETFDASGTLRRSVARSYNTLGQLVGIKDGFNRTIFDASFSDSYDGIGNLMRSADALGIQRKQGYDALNRLVSTIDNYNGTDAATQNTQSVFAYDPRDNLQGVSDPDGLNTTYDYDGLGNTKAVHSPDTGTSSYTYDAAGNRVQATDARGVVSHSIFDALDRITATTYPNSNANISYRYDEADSVTGCVGSYPMGRLTSVVETAVTTVYCYDARGNVVQKRQTQGTAVDMVSYSYTLANRLTSTRTPDGTIIQYSRDSAGRINGVTTQSPGSSAGSVVTNVSYLPFGPIASYTLGNGQALTRTYDANYAVTDIVSPALNLHFARDAMGNITALGNAAGANPAIETYSYDPLYRLTGLKDAQGRAIEAYSYNKTGDRLSKASNGLATGTYGYQTGTHWLTSIGNSARAYDANGNTTGNATGSDMFGYGYDDRNRMTVVQRNGQTVGSYAYNAMGQRVSKSATSTQRFAYDEDSQLLGEYGATSRNYVWLEAVPVAVIDNSGAGNTVGYVHADGLNTPRVITDATGAPTWQLSNSGNPFSEQQPISSNGYVFNLRFPGQYVDAESGLIQNGYRNYCPECGRYIQSDPVGLAAGVSTFGYVRGNPLTSVDPLGLDALTVPAPAVPAPTTLPAPGTGGVPNFGPAANEPLAPRPLPIGGGLCRALGAIGALVYPSPTADSCTDEPRPSAELNCPGDDDKCKAIQRAIYEAMTVLQGRIDDLLSDSWRLYDTAHSVRNPAYPPEVGTWMGHIQQAQGWQNRLRNLIKKAVENGCPIPPGAWGLATRPLPSMPRGH
jgi:RHS repeat-associated protein